MESLFILSTGTLKNICIKLLWRCMNKIVLILLSIVMVPAFSCGSIFPSLYCKNKQHRIAAVSKYCRDHNVDKVDGKGRTLLFLVKYPESVKLLVAAKVGINHRDVDGETALSRALLNSHSTIKLIEGLVGAGANPWIISSNGKSVVERLTIYEKCRRVDAIYFDDKYLGYVETSIFKDGATRGEKILKIIRAAAV